MSDPSDPMGANDPTHSFSATAPDPGAPGQEPSGQAKGASEESGPAAGDTGGARNPAADEIMTNLRSAMSSLGVAVSKIGELAQTQFRTEWEQAKPELNRTLDEMRRGVDSVADRLQTTLGSRTRGGAAPTSDTAGSGPAETPAPAEPAAQETAWRPLDDTPAQTDR